MTARIPRKQGPFCSAQPTIHRPSGTPSSVQVRRPVKTRPAEKPETDLDHLRIQRLALPLLHFGEGGTETERRPVGPVRGHGFHHIGHGKDPGLEPDPGSGEVVGIATAVQPLVVLVSNHRHGIRQVEVLENGMSMLRVTPDDLELGLRQVPSGRQDLNRYRNLADIVDITGQTEGLTGPPIQSKGTTDGGRERSDPALVQARVGVSEVTHVGQGADGTDRLLVPARHARAFRLGVVR